MARRSNYDKFPVVRLSDCQDQLWRGYATIVDRLAQTLADRGKRGGVLVVETYPGVDDAELLSALRRGLRPARVVDALDLRLPESQVLARIDHSLSDDRIFGVMSDCELADFFDEDKLQAARRVVAQWSEGLLIVYGVGAALVARGDCLVYADMARWEIQQRFRRGQGNWGAGNGGEDFFRKYKRGYFVEWRAADRHKRRVFDDVDFFLDTHVPNDPKLLAAEAMHAGLAQTVRRPFRVVPFFDPAPWGGQWMKEVCDLDRSAANYGWCFDCVPEENSLLFDVGGTRFESPSLNLVHRHPRELLGEKVVERFGCEFPIRFDFLDTMRGGNLSLQVHPLTEYIRQTFGMAYTQDESYYLLDADEGATVYLGLKEGVDPAAMIADLQEAQRSAERPFPVETYVHRRPAMKHDHFLIPAGTVHCSGSSGMVLEISATPYIFTFKMWDWGRLGLDGRPRPVHLDHALANIQWDRTAEWVERNLVNRCEPAASGVGWREERTGLHELEFIETRRHWFSGTVPHNTGGGVNVLNLVQGQEAIVESPDAAFEPFVVHYAETFIVPAAVGAYTIRPHGAAEGTPCATMKAFVRG